MYLQMVWMLTIATVAIEGVIAWYLPAWRKFTVASKYSKILDLGFGFFISWFLGMMFQAPSGLIVFMAAICSTIISIPMYPIMEWCDKNRKEIAQAYAKIRQITIDTAILVYKLLRLLTIPIRMMRWGHQQYQAVKIAVKTSS